MTWQLVYTKQAQKDVKKLAVAGLKQKEQELLAVLTSNPYQNPPHSRSWLETSAVLIHDASTFSIA